MHNNNDALQYDKKLNHFQNLQKKIGIAYI